MKFMVVDTETTSLDPWNTRVIEIAICKVDLECSSYECLYESLVGYERVPKTAWIFKHSDLTPEIINNAYPEKNVFTVANEVRKVIQGSLVTSYNTSFDLTILSRSPWRFKEITQPAFCIMEAAKPVCNIPHHYYGVKWAKLTTAYQMLVGKPLPSLYHRARIDCEMATQVLLKLIENNQYNPNRGK